MEIVTNYSEVFSALKAQATRNVTTVPDENFGAAILFAAAQNDLKFMKNLCKVNPKLKVCEDRHHFTPLHFAGLHDDPVVLEYLLTNHLDELDINFNNKLGHAPIHTAILKGDSNIQQSHRPLFKSIDLFIEAGALLDCLQYADNTTRSILPALVTNFVIECEYLLQKYPEQFNFEIVGRNGATPLGFAISRSPSPTIVQLLIESKAKSTTTCCGDTKFNPLLNLYIDNTVMPLPELIKLSDFLLQDEQFKHDTNINGDKPFRLIDFGSPTTGNFSITIPDDRRVPFVELLLKHNATIDHYNDSPTPYLTRLLRCTPKPQAGR